METQQTTPAEPSISELRAHFADTPAPKAEAAEAPAAEPKIETPEPKADEVATPGPAAEENKEADAGPAVTETEAVETEEELAPNVQKKIAKEVARQARADRAILEAISNRKAAEDKLSKLTADKPGSEPVPTTASTANEGKPVRPDLNTFPGTYEEFKVAQTTYDADLEAYLIAKTEQATEQRLTERQRDEAIKRDWAEATTTHGADFPDLMKTLAAGAPEGLQLAISNLRNWSTVAVHLAKHPDELAAIAKTFEANQIDAISDLGALQYRLQQESKTPEPPKVPAVTKPVKPLPAPPAKPGGSATATASIDLEKADQKTFNRVMKGILAR